MTIAITQAKIGRSMKKRAISVALARRRGARVRAVRRNDRDRGTDRGLLEARGDHLVTVAHAIGDDPVRARGGGDLHRTLRHGAVVDDPDEGIAGAVAHHRVLRQRDRAARHRLRQIDLDIHAGQQQAVGVLEGHAQGDHAGGRLDVRLGGGEMAGLVIDRAVGQDQPRRAGGAHLAALGGRGQAQDVGRRLGDVDIDGVERADRGKGRRLLRRDERAGGRLRQADDAGDGRADGGAVKVDLGAHQLRLCKLQRRIGGLPRGHGGIALLRRAGVVAEQLDRALLLGHREIAVRLRLRHRGAGRGDRGAVALVLDLVKRRAFLDRGAFVEQPFADDTRDLRPDLGDGRGLDPTGQTRGQREVGGMGGDDGDPRGALCLLGEKRGGGKGQRHEGQNPEGSGKGHERTFGPGEEDGLSACHRRRRR
ncbi:hypothetical protein SDC9_38409 [bioreactor metagenome]|uniref:Uncharacterized protein n=1 Tax=bioreactor metagenome TaxID=1076179 RepID=A0A644VLV4_9ZZZZ